MMNCRGKRLLIVGGAFQHCKVVESAQSMGITAYVTDYLPYEQAPAKAIADFSYQFNITDYENIRALCLREKIDGAIALALDACQRPYQHICKMMNFPCFGTEEQFITLTDKNAFKKCCRRNGVDVIPGYSISDFQDKAECTRKVDFPVLIKPGESRGSRGQSICFTHEEAIPAIKKALRESSNGEVVIEKAMNGKSDFSVSYVILNGTPYLTRLCDRFTGSAEDCLNRLCIASVSPSRYTELYLSEAEPAVKKMIADIGLRNAPFFLQGFIDDGRVRFYDMGLRFAGGEYERLYESAAGISPVDPMVEFAVTGEVSDSLTGKFQGNWDLKGNISVQISIALRAGTIAKINGWDEIKAMGEVVSCFARYEAGREIRASHDINQRFCEISLLCSDREKAEHAVSDIYRTLQIIDEHGNDMKVSLLEPGSITLRR